MLRRGAGTECGTSLRVLDALECTAVHADGSLQVAGLAPIDVTALAAEAERFAQPPRCA